MKLYYIILTCGKYKHTRCEWVRNSWLQHIHPDDSYSFLSGEADESDRVLGWNTPDGYDGCSQKYLTFFREMNIDADWIVLVDDDTFVFPDKIRTLLQSYNSEDHLFVGKFLGGPIPTMSGGAGICLSKGLYHAIRQYVNTRDCPLGTIYSDVELARWIMDIPTAHYIHNPYFNSHSHLEEGDIKTAITFHFVTEELFRFYGRLLSIGTAQNVSDIDGTNQVIHQKVNPLRVFRIPIRTNRV